MSGEDECGLYKNKIIVKHPKHLPHNERKKSFGGLPLSSIVDELVDSGFFHTGYADGAICFLCALGFEGWSLGEKPWITHATWNPRCSYVISRRSDNICKKKVKVSKNGCRRCCIRPADALTIPCHHLNTCMRCSARLVFCNICGKAIESVICVRLGVSTASLAPLSTESIDLRVNHSVLDEVGQLREWD